MRTRWVEAVLHALDQHIWKARMSLGNSSESSCRLIQITQANKAPLCVGFGQPINFLMREKEANPEFPLLRIAEAAVVETRKLPSVLCAPLVDHIGIALVLVLTWLNRSDSKLSLDSTLKRCPA